MQRYFIESKFFSDHQISIPQADAYHMAKVMRMKEKEQVIVCNEDKGIFLTEIVSINEKEAIVQIIKPLEEEKELPFKVTIAQGIVRREKQEEVIQKITALGAYEYIPVIMQRSIVKVREEKQEKRQERLNRIVKEASEQSKRSILMKVRNPISFSELLQLKEYDRVLYAYEEEDSLSQNFKKILKEPLGSILILIGPEGGIDPSEVSLLKKNHFIPISLGPRILRTELAPLYLLSAISYEVELK